MKTKQASTANVMFIMYICIYNKDKISENNVKLSSSQVLLILLTEDSKIYILFYLYNLRKQIK